MAVEIVEVLEGPVTSAYLHDVVGLLSSSKAQEKLRGYIMYV